MSDIHKLIKIAISKEIIIVFDEVFCDLLITTNQDFILADKLAYELGGLLNLVFIRGYSKNRNLPGLRIGYIFSKRQDLIKEIIDIQEERVFFATGSNYKDIIIADSFFQCIYTLQKNHPECSLEFIVNKTLNLFKSKGILMLYNQHNAIKDYLEFKEYTQLVKNFYLQNFNKNILCKEIEAITNTKAAFNTFIKLKNVNNINIFDFCLNLYLYYGIKIQPGPYFGFDQKTWENNLGFWMRITFSYESGKLRQALKKFIMFKDLYANKKSGFIATGFEF